MLEEAREVVLDALEERFGIVSSSMLSKIKGIQQREILRALFRTALRAKDLEEFNEVLKRVEE